MEGVRLLDVVQFFCRTTTTGCLQVKNGKDRGTLWLKDGAIVHAEIGRQQGEEAALVVLTWRYGDFSLQRRVEPPAVSIVTNWEGLVMRAACALDEHPVKAEGGVPTGAAGVLPIAAAGEVVDGVTGARDEAALPAEGPLASPTATEAQTAALVHLGETVHSLARDIGEALGLGPPVAVYGWGKTHRVALVVTADGSARLETEPLAAAGVTP